MSSHMRPSLFLILISILVLVIGIAFFARGVQDVQEAVLSSSWPTTTGKIVGARINVSGGTSRPLSSRTVGAFNYYPDILYAYTVGNNSYIGEVVYPRSFWSHGSSQRILARFPLQSQQIIHFSPADPQTAVLLPGLRLGTFQQLIFSTLIISVSILVGIRAHPYKPSWAAASNYVMLTIALQVIYLLITAYLE